MTRATQGLKVWSLGRRFVGGQDHGGPALEMARRGEPIAEALLARILVAVLTVFAAGTDSRSSFEGRWRDSAETDVAFKISRAEGNLLLLESPIDPFRQIQSEPRHPYAVELVEQDGVARPLRGQGAASGAYIRKIAPSLIRVGIEGLSYRDCEGAPTQ